MQGQKEGEGAMFSIINLESWLAEEAAIVQKPPGDREVYLHEWLQKLDEYLNSSQVTKVSSNCYDFGNLVCSGVHHHHHLRPILIINQIEF